MSSTTHGKRGKYHHGDLRAALIKSALSLIQDKGLDALTLRAAARQAGVSHAAPYRHYRDKEALLAAVVEACFIELLETLEAARSEHDDPLERLKSLAVAYIEYAITNRAQFKVMFGPAVKNKTDYPSLVEVTDRTFELLTSTTRACQESGVISEGNTLRIAVSAWSMIHGLTALYLDRQLEVVGFEQDDPKHLAEMVLTSLHVGIRKV